MSDNLPDVLAAIEDIIMDKVGGHVLRSGHDGSFTAAGGQVARLIESHVDAVRADAKREALEEAIAAVYSPNRSPNPSKKVTIQKVIDWLEIRKAGL